MQIGQPNNFALLIWIGIIVCAAIAGLMRLYFARETFATRQLLHQMAPPPWLKQGLSVLLTTLALIGIVLGLVDIRWGRTWREVPQRGVEVMFVLDVSRSMLAEDIVPNRMESAKQSIKDMVNEMAGDRVGLVLFAGDVKKQMPLTNHYSDFITSLDEIGPHNISRGGSNLGLAIETAASAFMEKTSDSRAIVLFTDGEYHESEPIATAKQVFQESAIRMFTVGLGDDAGARVPITQRRGQPSKFVRHNGQTVVSKRNDGVLEEIALATEGAYIPAGTKQVDMAAVYHRFVANLEEQDFDTARINAYVARYQWFLGFGLIMLLLDSFVRRITWRPAAQKTGYQSHESQSFTRKSAAVILVCACSLFGLSNEAQQVRGQDVPTQEVQTQQTEPQESQAEETASELVQQGQAALKKGETETAIEKFEAAREQGYSDHRLSYNLGIAQYSQGNLTAARDAWAQAAESLDNSVTASARYNLGNSYYAEALQRMQEAPKEGKSAAIGNLDLAIDHYLRSLASNPDDDDARTNIELAHRLKQQLQKEQQQNQDPQQQQQDQDQQQQDQKGENESEQNQDQQSPDSQGQDQEQPEDQQAPQNQQQDQQDGKGEQQQQQEQPSSENGEQDSKDQQDSGEQQGPQDDETQGQGDGEEDDKNEAGGAQQDKQDKKDGDLKAINESPETAPSGEDGDEGPLMTRQEARKLLQAVRDRELRQRIERLQRLRPRRVRVEKDW